MAVLVSVPVKEGRTPATCMGDIEETPRVIGLLFGRLETRLREWVVIRNAWSTEPAIDTQLAEEFDKSHSRHGCAPVAMHSDAARLQTVPRDAFRKQLL